MGWVGAGMVATAFLLARSSACRSDVHGPAEGPRGSVVEQGQGPGTRRSRAAPHHIGWWRRAVTARRRRRPAGRPGRPLACNRLASLACQAALRPGRRCRGATAGRLTARGGGVGWQVLLVLARVRVTPG